jgi:arylsulfatase A-like enzyme
MNAICLVIDRLHVGYLGCYGNSWISTRNFDRLAADGFLFDQALIESPDLAAQYASLASGSHVLRRAMPGHAAPSLIERLNASDVHTALITDDPTVAHMPWAATIDDVIEIDLNRATIPVDEIHQTNLARFFAVAGQWLETAEEPFCLWLHCGSLGSSWDAPLEFRNAYCDEDDPPALADVVVPSRWLPENYDPDERLSIAHAYAGQVSLLDICLGTLLEGWAGVPAHARTLLSVMSARGFPLGEHRRIGPIDDALYAEMAHVPWIIRLPDGVGASDRSQALVQPYDFVPTLVEWLALPAIGNDPSDRSLLSLVRDEPNPYRDRAILVGEGEYRAIRTPAWYLLRRGEATGDASATQGPAVELYAKPDDRWEVNDVADRCAEVVDLLEQVLAESAQSPSETSPTPLAEVLLAGLD